MPPSQYTTPQRSLDQRMSALEQANQIRYYRAQLKRDIKAGRKQVIDLLTNPPKEIETMKFIELLLAMPRLGRVKANKFLQTCRISASKTVGGMSERQRSEVVYLLKQRY